MAIKQECTLFTGTLPGDKTGVVVGAIEREANCEAQLLPEEFYPSGLGIALPLGSPYKPSFDEA